jgi:hypothetical protein
MTFLMMWLECFFFYGPTLGCCSNMQGLAEQLVNNHRMPLGQLLLGSTFCMLHETIHRLLSCKPVGHIGGPWWFLQVWLSLYTTKVTDFPILNDGKLPSTDFAEDDEAVFRPYTSFCEATLSSPGDNLSTKLLVDWCDTIYYGLYEEIAWFAYNTASNFSVPSCYPFQDPLVNPDHSAHLTAFLFP